MYTVQVKWNREFHYNDYKEVKEVKELDEAIKLAVAMLDSGDGASVKGARVVDENEKVVWQYGKLVE